MRTHSQSIVFTLTLLICMSCATGKLIEVTPSESNVPIDVGEHRLFFIGDAGEINDIQTRTLAAVKKRIQSSSIPATVVYLGDNIYPKGVPDKQDSVDYKTAFDVLTSQIQAFNGVATQTIFIPGNHDWNKGHRGGLNAIRNQGRVIKDAGVKDTKQLPRKGCPGPEVIELTNDIVMLIIDSQWWLQDWRTETDINEDCEVLSRNDFVAAFTEALKDYQEQQVIVAMHHPLVSAGSHGGFFTARDHIFPLTNVARGLYLPLPVIGSIYPIYRSNFGSVQDVAHHKYYALKTALLSAAKNHENVVFVSGHEHTLEYHKSEGHEFLVSGSGSRTTEIGKPKTLQFGHGASGFMQLNLKSNGAMDLLVWESGEGMSDAPVYRTALSSGVRKSTEQKTYPDISGMPATISRVISTDYDKGGMYRFLFGERYRDIYEIPVTAQVLKLSEAKGGLKPVQKGGGAQTNSLRLENPQGLEYSARSMNKDASKLLPAGLKNTFFSDILQDQFTASHPYAAFIIPDMAEKAGIYHTNPEFIYLPKQKALEPYSDEFGDQTYLFEERPSGDWSSYDNFGNSKNIISYGDVIEETMDDYRNRVDQVFTVRSRMFDFFLGDWDRHDDQWRWAEIERTDGKGNLYRPIPRDRDQAFADYGGVILGMARWFAPITRKLGTFTPDIKSMKWFNDNGKWFDHDFLNELTEEQFVQMAREVQAAMTDAVIEENLHKLPPDVFAERGEEIVATLKSRRDKLPEFASEYYKILAKEVYIRGTNNSDYFEVTRSSGQTKIEVFDSNKEGEKLERYYSRTFSNKETDEIQLYGLEGDDQLVINGDAAGGIRVYFVGGEDDDLVQTGQDKHYGAIKVLDTQERGEMIAGSSVSYKQVPDDQNVYQRRAYAYDYAVPKVIIAGNPDDGFLFGGGVNWVNQGFQKTPYANQHTLTGFYALSTMAYGFNYAGEWIDVLGKVDLGLDAGYQGPTFVQNFFGFGNDSEESDSENKDYYRVRKQGYQLLPYLRLGNELGSSLKLRTGIQSHEVEASAGRFVTNPLSGLNTDVFDELRFGVGALEYQYRIVDDPLIVRRGIDFDVAAGMDFPLQGEDDPHSYLKTSLATYYQFKHLGKPVLATRVGMEWHGGDYQFYQRAILGSHANFRGLRKERFVGERMFYHNTDLRIRLSQWRSYYLPASFGIQLNFDHGRVWVDGEDSDTWHYAYGGGFWLSPFQTLLISLNYHQSDVDKRISVAMGFLF